MLFNERDILIRTLQNSELRLEAEKWRALHVEDDKAAVPNNPLLSIRRWFRTLQSMNIKQRYWTTQQPAR